MRLTVLGASPACQNPGGACSGYLVEQEGTALVLDCGSGVFSRLQGYVAPEAVRAIVISHMHADHTLDLIQYRYYLFFARQFDAALPRPALYLPPGGHARLLELSRFQDPSPDFYAETFVVHEYDPDALLSVGPLRIGFVPVVHIPHTYAMRIEGAGTLAFSADSGPCEGLARVAHGSDLFLCECANLEGSSYPLHLTPRQAGEAARAAGTRRLLLTHRWWGYGIEVAIAEAATLFEGPVDLAREDQRITVAP